jgi:hypothetical protein
VRFRFPRPRSRAQKTGAELAAAVTLGTAIGAELRKALRDGGPIAVEHKHVYGARPPLPKPARMMIAWRMQDGQELKSYVPLGFREHVMPWPQWLDPVRNPQQWPPVLVRFDMEYDQP